MIFLDRSWVDTLQLAFRQDTKQIPAKIKGRIDIAILVQPLIDELLLETVRKTQVELVSGRESLFTDDGDKVTEASSLRIGIVELVRDFTMILSGPTLSNTLLHQPRERGCRVDRRVDAFPV